MDKEAFEALEEEERVDTLMSITIRRLVDAVKKEFPHVDLEVGEANHKTWVKLHVHEKVFIRASLTETKYGGSANNYDVAAQVAHGFRGVTYTSPLIVCPPIRPANYNEIATGICKPHTIDATELIGVAKRYINRWGWLSELDITVPKWLEITPAPHPEWCHVSTGEKAFNANIEKTELKEFVAYLTKVKADAKKMPEVEKKAEGSRSARKLKQAAKK